MTIASKPNGGPAFPTRGQSPAAGMSLRDYMATQCLKNWGLTEHETQEDAKKAAAICYTYADAMLVERGKTIGTEQKV